MEFSIVIPVYGCEKCLEPLFRRISQAMVQVTSKYEIIFVDDCSFDNSHAELINLFKLNSNVRIVQLSRNFGQHAAITAGLAHAKGDFCIVMDCDLQDPPESIPDLINKIREGYEIVYARRERQNSLFRNITGTIYGYLLRFFSDYPFHKNYGTFSIISKKVVNNYLSFSDQDRHYLHILFYMGFKSSEISIAQSPRFHGKSSYSLKALFRHAIGGIFFQTTVFLKLIIYIGFIISLIGFFSIIYLIYKYFSQGAAAGWTSLAVLNIFMGGIIISSIGVCGLYIGRIFNLVKSRPIYIVDRVYDHDSLK